MRLLSARGLESEVDLPFAGLSELCGRELEQIRLLPRPQAQALEGVLSGEGANTGDRLSIGVAILGLLAAIAQEAPLLVLVDDAQWLDRASAETLLFVARRLGKEGIALLVATRPGAVFDTDRPGVSRVFLTGLEETCARSVLENAHGPLAPQVVELLLKRSAGNPLALVELPRVLTRAQRDGSELIPEPLPLGQTLGDALRHRLVGLTTATRHALLLAAASGTEAIGPVLDALAAGGLGSSSLDEAEAAGVLTLRDGRFEFRHPLLRAAVYSDASPAERRSAHALLARVTAGEASVWHRARATVGEDEAVAAELEEVGLDARARDAPAAATAALERAARLSVSREGRVRRLIGAASDAHAAGMLAAGMGLLDEALKLAAQPEERAAAQQVRGRILVMQGRTEAAHRLLVAEAEEIRELDPERAAGMLAEACLDCLLKLDVPRARAIADQAAAAAVRASPGAQAFAAVMQAGALVLAGERAQANALLDRWLPVLRHAEVSRTSEILSLAAQLLFWLERHDLAAEVLEALTTSAREASAPSRLVLPLSCQADLDLRRGRWSIAEARAEEAGSLGAEVSTSVFTAYPLETLARLAAGRGDEQHCREAASAATGLIEAHDNELGRLYVRSALGLLELGLGRIDAALGHLEPAASLAERRGLAEPNAVHWHADLVESYIRNGEQDAAHDALLALERQGEHTRGRWALGTAARCRGLLAPDHEFDACFATALEHLHSLNARFELARTHLCHGEQLRRAGRRRDARRPLRLAVDAFSELDAAPWTSRAQAELRATGGVNAGARRDRTHRDELTAHEVKSRPWWPAGRPTGKPRRRSSSRPRRSSSTSRRSIASSGSPSAPSSRSWPPSAAGWSAERRKPSRGSVSMSRSRPVPCYNRPSAGGRSAHLLGGHCALVAGYTYAVALHVG